MKKKNHSTQKLEAITFNTLVVGVVLDFISLGMDVYSAWDSYATFAANMNMISENVEVLDIIKENTTDDNLKSACNELREALKEESELNAQKWQDMLDAAGCKGYRMAIAAFGAKIPVIGKYVVAVVAAVGVVDFLTNISDVAKQCTGVYALSSAASYMASDYDSMMNKYTNGSNSNGKYKIVYTNYSDASDMYCNLAVLRQVAEEQMQNANKANAWYIEWLFTKIIYKESNISENVEKLKKEAFVYKYIGQM